MDECRLPDRAIVVVEGDDGESLLNRLFTNSVLDMRVGTARYAALLSPQGKLLFDFLVAKRPDAFWIDVARSMAADLARKLNMFKMRANATIGVRDDLVVAASWDGPLMEAPGAVFRDPRHNDLGYRIVATCTDLLAVPDDSRSYRTHRIALGIPEGGVDFPYGDTFVHDANLDLLHGVDFAKGCYVGQEVVSRVHHRGSARKRIVQVTFYGDAADPGTALLVGEGPPIGTITSVEGRVGLAAVRLDRLDDAEAIAAPVLAGGTLVGIKRPQESHVTPPSYADHDF